MSMRKYLSAISLLCLTTATAIGQSHITLTFTSAFDGSYVKTDSILVENISKGCDTLLRFPDTVLALEVVSGIQKNEIMDHFAITQNQPNPFSKVTTFSVVVPLKANVDIFILDHSGRKVALLSRELPAGKNLFTFSGGTDLVYFIAASAGKSSRVMKMVRTGWDEVTGNEKLDYNGVITSTEVTKSGNHKSSFSFSAGDSLRMTGYGMTPLQFRSSDILFDRPARDTLLLFELKEGIPCPVEPALFHEGKCYTTRLIGDQCWFRENVNAGIRIDANVSQSDNGIIEKYCYNNNPVNCDVYGGLYQWYEAMQYSNQQGTRGICPEGWHLPTDGEWNILSNLLGGETSAGGPIKEAGYEHWIQPNTGATDSTGFCALPAGMYFDNGFHHFRTNIEYWSSTNSYGPYAWYRILYNNNAQLVRTNYYEKTTARSVRCIRD